MLRLIVRNPLSRLHPTGPESEEHFRLNAIECVGWMFEVVALEGRRIDKLLPVKCAS
jgi:hypothetical protein